MYTSLSLEGDGHVQGPETGARAGAAAGAGELEEIRSRLEHARWTKVHVGNKEDLHWKKQAYNFAAPVFPPDKDSSS
ncbi:unnamed protein product [Discosporangium mesarthrocarpum]